MFDSRIFLQRPIDSGVLKGPLAILIKVGRHFFLSITFPGLTFWIGSSSRNSSGESIQR